AITSFTPARCRPAGWVAGPTVIWPTSSRWRSIPITAPTSPSPMTTCTARSARVRAPPAQTTARRRFGWACRTSPASSRQIRTSSSLLKIRARASKRLPNADQRWRRGRVVARLPARWVSTRRRQDFAVTVLLHLRAQVRFRETAKARGLLVHQVDRLRWSRHGACDYGEVDALTV